MKFLPIIIGCSYNNELKGSVNDAILMYNLFYNYINLEKPILLIDKYRKININILQKHLNKSENLLIYFSGHCSYNGKIKISDHELSCSEIINLVYKPNDIIFIMDCCHSNTFYYDKYKFIYCTNNNEVAKECEVNTSKLLEYPLVLLDKTKNKCPIGVFTYFYFLLNKKNMNIFVGKNKVWRKIKRKYKQTYNEIL
jgi:glycosylphosphatidylinositol transamidase (GPIT) subunit GPI8